jgi:hypothetical protein
MHDATWHSHQLRFGYAYYILIALEIGINVNAANIYMLASLVIFRH